MASKPSIGYLGPEGTFAHLAVQRRFGKGRRLVPLPTVKEVFDFVLRGGKADMGIVPIENSSGGTIYDTVDRLVDHRYPLFIQESLSINVRLALLGRNREKIRVIYSHFVPLYHCEKWLHRHFPKAELRETSSTAKAVKAAAEEEGAAAIGNQQAGEIYQLKILEYPIEQDVPNVTQFFVLGHRSLIPRDASRSTMIVALPNQPGALVDFLEPFRDAGINLSRIISRPVSGHPNTYVFLVDLVGKGNDPAVKKALTQAHKVSESIRSLGSYPVREPYES